MISHNFKKKKTFVRKQNKRKEGRKTEKVTRALILLTIFLLFTALSVADISFTWAACASKPASTAAKEEGMNKLISEFPTSWA